MEYNGLLYKHIHPKLITKDLFDECQAVRTGRKKTKYKRTEKPFILKGLLKCKHCQCSYSLEVKKEKYVYMRPTKSRGSCNYCYHLSEEKILLQVENALKGMHIPQDILEEIDKELEDSNQAEHKHQMQEINKLTAKLEQTQTRLKRARELYLDNQLQKEEYQEIIADLEVEMQNLTTKL